MSSTRELKTRIRSVGSTKQITKAMQLVSASKMRKAQRKDVESTPYASIARDILGYLSRQNVTNDRPAFRQREVKSRLIILVASDKGLAGLYNNNVFKEYIESIKSDKENGVNSNVIAIGKRASQFVSRIKDVNFLGSYENLPDDILGQSFMAVLLTIRDQFMSEKVDEVDIIYTKFINSLKQEITVEKLLPIVPVASDDNYKLDAIYEPSPTVVLDKIVYKLISSQIYKALIDSRASEHSMRMLAMKNATDNANNLIDDLTLAMNKARQDYITRELAEISGGVEALEQ
jgi:F-type H+-transporting ATPase subunit gamma